LIAGSDSVPGAYSFKALLTDVAPTLAALLKVEAPGGSVGRALTEIIKKPDH
jgi:hypothetical protein